MIKRQAFHLFTDNPVIITASSDQGETLNYIPGSALWGALAARIYADCTDSWDMFHSGALKISDAYPVLDGKIAWPAPLSLHYKKGETADLDHAVCLASTDWSEPGQPRQFRDGFLTRSSKVLQVPRLEDAIKTAINPETGAAADAQIFASEAISAGQSFVFWVEGPKVLVDEADTGLSRLCYLGRSRSAEFGKVSLSRVDLPEWPQGKQINGKTTYVWLLSDLCLSDQYGQPTLCPDNLDGPVKGEVNWARSHVRARTYWPYNAKWRCRALARQVIRQGSVFCLPEASGACGFVWLGEENSTGCGLAYVSELPPLEAIKDLVEFPVEPDTQTTSEQQTTLVNWLVTQANTEMSRDEAMERANTLSRELLDLLFNARKHTANPGCGPTKSQLNHLRNAIDGSGEGRSARMAKLWGADEKANEDPAWGFLVADRDGKMIPLFRWVTDEISGYGDDPDKAAALIKALELAAKQLDDQEGGG